MLFTVALTLLSCNRNTVFDHYMAVDNSAWHRADTLRCTATPLLSAGEYTEEVSLRLSDDYPFQNLSIIIEQQITSQRGAISPSDGVSSVANSQSLNNRPTLFRDTVAFDFSVLDSTSESRGIVFRHYSKPLRRLSLSPGDTISFSIRHYMTRECLTGITDVGVRIERK